MPLDLFDRPYLCKGGDGTSHIVRLQDYVDADLLSSAAVIGDNIKRAEKELADAASQTPSGVGSAFDATLYPRHWKERSPPTKEGQRSCFTVAQFNTLARGLSSGPVDTPFPRKDSMKHECYGGFTALSDPATVLDFDGTRKWRLLQVLLGGGLASDGEDCETNPNEGCQPAFDILALEEVDEYPSFFRPALTSDEDGTVPCEPSIEGVERASSNVYQGVFQPKLHSPSVPLGYYSDGVALLWNREKFQTISRPSSSDHWIDSGSFDSSNQVYVMVPLQVRDTNKFIVVAATHLKAKKGPENERFRRKQASELRQRVERMADTIKEQGWKDVSILIAGDFNSEPSESAVGCILTRDECNNNNTSWRFESAYPLDDTLFTTWKTRNSGLVRRTIDYIFHASNCGEDDRKGIRCSHYLSVPGDEEVEQGGFPGFRYPSDHLLIAAKYEC